MSHLLKMQSALSMPDFFRYALLIFKWKAAAKPSQTGESGASLPENFFQKAEEIKNKTIEKESGTIPNSLLSMRAVFSLLSAICPPGIFYRNKSPPFSVRERAPFRCDKTRRFFSTFFR